MDKILVSVPKGGSGTVEILEKETGAYIQLDKTNQLSWEWLHQLVARPRLLLLESVTVTPKCYTCHITV